MNDEIEQNVKILQKFTDHYIKAVGDRIGNIISPTNISDSFLFKIPNNLNRMKHMLWQSIQLKYSVPKIAYSISNDFSKQETQEIEKALQELYKSTNIPSSFGCDNTNQITKCIEIKRELNDNLLSSFNQNDLSINIKRLSDNNLILYKILRSLEFQYSYEEYDFYKDVEEAYKAFEYLEKNNKQSLITSKNNDNLCLCILGRINTLIICVNLNIECLKE